MVTACSVPAQGFCKRPHNKTRKHPVALWGFDWIIINIIYLLRRGIIILLSMQLILYKGLFWKMLVWIKNKLIRIIDNFVIFSKMVSERYILMFIVSMTFFYWSECLSCFFISFRLPPLFTFWMYRNLSWRWRRHLQWKISLVYEMKHIFNIFYL